MKTNGIVAAAIALVVSGAITQEDASLKAERIEAELCANESESLRNELAVMRECMELFDAREAAINDWRGNA